MKAYFSVDVEQDCPPYLNTWRGIEEGLPRLLALLAEEDVRGTFFTTGEVARKYPSFVQSIVDGGHELGCHGDLHRNFGTLDARESEIEIARSSETLRAFAPVTSFRAPYLTFPREYVPLLAKYGYRLDSSEGRHKNFRATVHEDEGVLRVPASVTSSTLRWPSAPRNALLSRLREPAVLFVHPWEFVDFRRERLRFDCRFRTGDMALACVRSALRLLKAHGATFDVMREYSAS
ncbi:MAG: polysaccharide deacetylase family protein [Acidobacteriaceae bacterium]|nr:polysaccharide deacetylase family protein [Acidobacteriaceae bacterium]